MAATYPQTSAGDCQEDKEEPIFPYSGGNAHSTVIKRAVATRRFTQNGIGEEKSDYDTNERYRIVRTDSSKYEDRNSQRQCQHLPRFNWPVFIENRSFKIWIGLVPNSDQQTSCQQDICPGKPR